ncbi:MAG: hypothetical protein V1773_01290 [bacterium]
MTKKINFALFFAIITFFYGCVCQKCLKSGYDFEISDTVTTSAEKYITDKTGKDFYNNNIFPNYVNSKEILGNYELHYVLIMPDKDYVQEEIFFTIDKAGKVLEKYEIAGIPNCKDNPDECIFNITEKQAIKIAQDADLAKGVKDWKVSFRWSMEYDRYIWHILSITYETGKADYYKASGEEMVINPADGSIILQRKWEIK